MKIKPKVGIRPVLDGRRSVRDANEELTMNTAKRVAALITSSLKHSNGDKIECVLPDTCIGGVAEAAMTAEKFKKENVGVSLTISHTWAFGTETLDMDPTIPKAIWGVNGTERPGAVYLAAALAANSQKGFPTFSIYGHDVQDRDDTTIPDDVKKKILSFIKAGLAVAEMRGKSYLSIGGVSMGIGGSIVQEDFFTDYLAIRNEYVDMTEVIRRIEGEIYDKKEYEKAKAWVKNNCIEGEDLVNPKEMQRSRKDKDKEWETVIKMTLITRDLMRGNAKLAAKGYKEEALGHNAIVAGFQGQRHWSDFCSVPDFTEAMLNSSFDWNGIREAFVVATENDSLNGISMLFGHLLTDTAQIFSDIRTYWSPKAVKRVTGKDLGGKAANGIIHLINSGSTTLDATGRQKDAENNSVMKPFWELTDKDVKNCLANTKWSPAELAYFKGGGFSSLFRTEGEMPVTMCRINLIKNLGPVLQIAEGYTVDLPDNIHDALDKRTSPSWPTTWFAPILTGQGPFCDVYSVMANWGANHAAISYGHIGDQLIILASMLRIPVNMHNVAPERVFRPSTWAAFGTSDLESADFRACKNFGPLYK